MAIMDRIEASSQQDDARCRHTSQSRCTRKSEYKAASGVPVSGCQL
jgi:hypothetical protein